MLWRVLIVALVALFFYLQYVLWFGDGGVSDNAGIQQHMQQLEQANQKITAKNKLIQTDIKDLRQGNQAVEERARQNLGMIKQNETFYRIVPKRANTSMH